MASVTRFAMLSQSGWFPITPVSGLK